MKKILCSLAIIIALVCVCTACNNAQSPTISISEDGYWVIDGEKTDVKAQGEKGDQGIQGEKGDQGIQGEKGDKGDKGDNGADATATNENPQGLAFYLKDDGTYAVEIGYAKYLSKIEIPATYNGKAVTEVGRFCDDSGNSILAEIFIPNSVTTIGERAFYNCDGLTSVTIGNSVTTIGSSAFYGCSNLTSVTIGNSVTTIGSSAFSYCDGLTSVTIGDSVTTIGDSAFRECSNLTSVMIPDSVTTIGDSAFNGCSNLTSVTIPDSVTTIGYAAFYNCYNLTSVMIPDSVTTIGYFAFGDCSNLTSVTFANPNGWECEYYNDSTNVKAISASDLSNPSTAAQYLRSTYIWYYWHRIE